MVMEITSNYNAYENMYSAQKIGIDKKNELTEKTKVDEKVTKKKTNEEYLKSLQKQVPYMKLQIGTAVNTKKDGMVDVLDINPKLLEKMQNDPEAAKKYSQRIKDVEAAHKFVDSYLKSTGSTVVCSHAYLDENGNYCNFTVSVHKDELNEKLRKEAKENAIKQSEKIREKNRESKEQIAEKIDKESEKEKDKALVKAEEMLAQKLSESGNGELYFNNNEMQIIVNAMSERNDEKKMHEPGQNLDYKV